jgi:hypothetical protein
MYEHPTPREDGEPEVVRLRCDNDYREEYEMKGFRFLYLAEPEPLVMEPGHTLVPGAGYDPIDEANRKPSREPKGEPEA